MTTGRTSAGPSSLNDATVDRLNMECKSMIRRGVCNMECVALGAHIGWCGECWDALGKEGTR